MNPGTINIGNYRFIKPIGKGGSGTVYLAEDLINKILVAIKKITIVRTGNIEMDKKEKYAYN